MITFLVSSVQMWYWFFTVFLFSTFSLKWIPTSEQLLMNHFSVTRHRSKLGTSSEDLLSNVIVLQLSEKIRKSLKEERIPGELHKLTARIQQRTAVSFWRKTTHCQALNWTKHTAKGLCGTRPVSTGPRASDRPSDRMQAAGDLQGDWLAWASS